MEGGRGGGREGGRGGGEGGTEGRGREGWRGGRKGGRDGVIEEGGRDGGEEGTEGREGWRGGRDGGEGGMEGRKERGREGGTEGLSSLLPSRSYSSLHKSGREGRIKCHGVYTVLSTQMIPMYILCIFTSPLIISAAWIIGKSISYLYTGCVLEAPCLMAPCIPHKQQLEGIFKLTLVLLFIAHYL